MSRTSSSCAAMQSSESGRILSSVIAIWNVVNSAASLGSEPMIADDAPSPIIACPTSEPRLLSDGPRKIIAVLCEQTTSTRALALFSARSLAIRRTLPPAKQPCWNVQRHNAKIRYDSLGIIEENVKLVTHIGIEDLW